MSVDWIRNLPSGQDWNFDVPRWVDAQHVGQVQYENPGYRADAGIDQYLYKDGFTVGDDRYGSWGGENRDFVSGDSLRYVGFGDEYGFGLMTKTADKVGTVIPYRLEGDRYVADLNRAYRGTMNTTGGDAMRGLMSVALAAVGGGALGTTAQTAANAYNAANSAYNAYQAADAGDWGSAIASGAGAVAGGANIGGYTDLANYARLAQSGANAYNAYENENYGGLLSSIGSGVSAYNNIGNDMDSFGGDFSGDPYNSDPYYESGDFPTDPYDGGGNAWNMYDSGDPYNSDPYYEPGSFPTTPNDSYSGFNWGQFGSGLFQMGGFLSRFLGGNSGGNPAHGGSGAPRGQGGNLGGGGFDLGSLLSAYYGSQAAGDYADQVRGIAANMRSDASPYLERLARSYTNPSEYLESPEMQARLGLEANKYAGIDAASGRLSNDIDRTKKLQDYGMAAIGDYRRGLQGSISSVYRPEAIANLYRDAAGRETSRYGGYSRLVGNQGGGPNTGGSGGFGVNDLLGIINQGGDLIGDAWDWISDWWEEE